MAIEEILSSKGRVKILKILSEIGELNISEIARRAGLNYATTNRHLGVLEEHGLVRHKRFGRIRIFRFNEENRRAELVRRLMELWEQTDTSR
ncbi:MAG: winged helix-turn-helix domain-containing protein [Candidatus Bathyarchaeota archaeon]|nr:winged helix-turn-helix domain-containing protein [Candidatus Bathyarchaeota archaeon]MDH5733167.1 winged helix-turn-helix domain-containing protein [Candidatus Bathyarchaeota archaeon]